MKDNVVWACTFDLEGRRYGFMTSNMVEVFNKVLKGIHSLPVTTIMEYSFHKCNVYFLIGAEVVLLHVKPPHGIEASSPPRVDSIPQGALAPRCTT